MMEVSEVKAQLKQLEVALELGENKRQHYEKESCLEKQKANNAVLEAKRLQMMVFYLCLPQGLSFL